MLMPSVDILNVIILNFAAPWFFFFLTLSLTFSDDKENDLIVNHIKLFLFVTDAASSNVIKLFLSVNYGFS